MNKWLNIIIGIGLISSAQSSSAQSSLGDAEITIRFDKLAQEDKIAIQRGGSVADMECFYYIYEKIKKEENTQKWYVKIDGGEDTVFFGAADSDYNYACNNGRLVTYEIGEMSVIKNFNSSN